MLEWQRINYAVHRLALRWASFEYPGETPTDEGTYSDYVTTLRRLLSATEDINRATKIVDAVLAQAKRLRQSSKWVDRELKFEANLEERAKDARLENPYNRKRMMLLDLNAEESLSTAGALDLYNERLKRFKDDEETNPLD